MAVEEPENKIQTLFKQVCFDICEVGSGSL